MSWYFLQHVRLQSLNWKFLFPDYYFCLRFDLDCDADQESKASLLKLTERYCVVYQTLVNSPPIAESFGKAA